MEELGNKIDKLLEKVSSPREGILGSAPVEGLQLMGSGTRTRVGEHRESSVGRAPMNFSHSRWEIPHFDGEDPHAWLRKCERYFQYNRITDPQQKLEEAVLHLTGKAESWFFSYHVSKGIVRWADFATEICNRFQWASNSKLNLIGEFKNIEQKGTVEKYLEEFEELKAWVLIRNPTIPEEFFLEFFIEGLKEEIRHSVKMLDPYSFSKVVEKARHQENLLESLSKDKFKRNRGVSTGLVNQNSRFTNNSMGNQANKVFESRRAQWLCYKYGDKYVPCHQCKQKQLNVISATTEQEGEEQSGMEHEGDSLELQEEVVDEAVSLNALSGAEVPNTIRLRRESKKNSMSILLDSGSTHSFLDIETAKKMGCVVKVTSPMRVTVVNGNHVMSYHTCPSFKWKIQGVEFEDSVRLLRLGEIR